MFLLTEEIIFPPVDQTHEDGILAIGGDLSPQRLLLAYRNGIFPWYSDDEPITWWCPNPRFVLFPNELVVRKSMKAVLKSNRFTYTINTNFTQVIENCKSIFRDGQDGTWITDEVQQAYTKLHELGYAISAEAWQNNILVGGLYGIKLGNVFFGESMFSTVSNASKFAFINFVQYLQTQHVQLIDCQIYTPHLESLGAKMIDRNTFIDLLKKLI
jgi:leucyl/phenylalanyl-tRNA---protein transferase